MTVPLLDLKAQYATIKTDIDRAVQSVIARQEFIMGREVGELETGVAAVSATQFAVACASGTDALLLPLNTLGLKPGDQVITPSFTFFATAGTIHNAGGTPVFVDIEADSFNVSPTAIEAAITPRTRAIVVVHLFGQMARMGEILAIAGKRGIPVIEDAAQAIGARRCMEGAWCRAGETGWAGTLSFFPSKNLGGWGDSGMILTQDDALADRMRKMRLHGGAKQYFHDFVGTNSRIDTLQAAVLLAKLPFLAGWSAARREKALAYTARLAGCPGITPPVIDPANEHIFHQYTIRAVRRDALMGHLKSRGIGCAVYYPLALHLQPCFAHLGYRRGSLPVTEAATADVISLPVYPELTQAQMDAVVEAVREFYD